MLDILAVWVFLHPNILGKAEIWLRDNGFKKSFAEKVSLDMQQISRLQKDMGTEGQTGLAYVCVIKQGHGDMVHVAAGWMHLVINLRLCAKMAWEIYKPEHCLNYVLS